MRKHPNLPTAKTFHNGMFFGPCRRREDRREGFGRIAAPQLVDIKAFGRIGSIGRVLPTSRHIRACMRVRACARAYTRGKPSQPSQLIVVASSCAQSIDTNYVGGFAICCSSNPPKPSRTLPTLPTSQTSAIHCSGRVCAGSCRIALIDCVVGLVMG